MPSLIRQALLSNNMETVDNAINRRARANNRGATNRSPDLFTDEGEARRIINDYIREKYKNRIFNRRTAHEAMRSLLQDPSTGLTQDFKNLLGGVGKKGRKDFVDYLMKEFAQEKTEIIESSGVELRSGEVRAGLQVNRDIYLITTKAGHIRARSFKTGRFVPMKAEYLENM